MQRGTREGGDDDGLGTGKDEGVVVVVRRNKVDMVAL